MLTQIAILLYLQRTYLTIIDQFALYTIETNRNWGIRATSRTESAHSALKSQLRSRVGHLDLLHKAIEGLKKKQHDSWDVALNDERKGALEFAQQPIFRELRGRVSFHALKLIRDNADKAREAQSDWDTGRNPGRWNWDCTRAYNAQWGLPCWHALRNAVSDEARGFIPLELIDVHWRLWKNAVPDIDPLYLVQDPHVIVRRHNAPAPRAGNRRDFSHDELPAAQRRRLAAH